MSPILCEAQIVVSNLSLSLTAVSGVKTSFYSAQRFVTDSSDTSFSLTNVKVQTLGPVNGNSGTNFFVAIYSNDSNSNYRPLALLPNGTLSGEASPTYGTINYTYTPTSLLTLSPNTSYWVVAGVSSGTAEFGWSAVASSSYTATGGTFSFPATAGHTSYSTNQGASWAAN